MVSLSLILATLVLCGPNTVAAKEMQTLTHAGGYSIPNLDPAQTASGTAHNVIMLAYEKLVAYKPGTSEIVPVLAESWEVSKDKCSYTFHLRKNIKFTDGTPFNAQAVKFSFDRLLAIKKGPSSRYLHIEKIEVVDDHTVKFTTKGVDATSFSKFASMAGPNIVSPTACKKHVKNGDWGQAWMRNHMVGTGPYILQEFMPAQYLTMVRNENYWRGWKGKHLDRIIIKAAPEYVPRKMMLKTGAADIIDYPAQRDLENLEKIPGVKLFQKSTLSPEVFLFNFKHEAMRNKKLRMALTYAFPYKAVCEAVGKGAKQLQGPLASTMWGHNKNLPVFHTDIPRAKQLLKEAGYKPGELTLVFHTLTLEFNRKIGEVTMSSMQKAGINLELEFLQWPLAVAMHHSQEKKADMIGYGTWPNADDPDAVLTYLYHSKSTVYRGYKNPRVDELLKKARQILDREKRLPYYFEIQKILVEDYAAIWAWNPPVSIAMRDYVKGFKHTGVYLGTYNYYDMYLEK